MGARDDIKKWDERWREYFNDSSDGIHGYGAYDHVGCIKGRTLDLGCGDFLGANYLKRDDNSFLVGIDSSDMALNGARYFMKGRGVAVSKGTATMLPFKDGSFDNVMMIEVATYLGRGYEKALDEACRVLKSGGRLVMSVWHRDFYTAQCKLDGVPMSGEGNVYTMDTDCMLFDTLVLFDEGSLKELFEGKGFKISEIAVHTSGDIFASGIYNTYPAGLPPRDTKAVIYIEAEKK